MTARDPLAPARPAPWQILALTSLAMLAFAGNSLLCRAALRDTAIDPATFTTIRIVSAALVLAAILSMRRRPMRLGGDWTSAAALAAYAIGFSFAYRGLTAATGALLLFGAVQATMVARGIFVGERLRIVQSHGVAVALAGLVALMWPGVSAPPLRDALLMLGAGVAWGVYSLRGAGSGDPIAATAGNFVRAIPFAALASVAFLDHAALDRIGVGYAIASGAVSSGIGYAIWYAALPSLRAITAATVQLGVPVIAMLGGLVLLGEAPGMRIVIASAAVLGGIALAVVPRGARSR